MDTEKSILETQKCRLRLRLTQFNRALFTFQNPEEPQPSVFMGEIEPWGHEDQLISVKIGYTGGASNESEMERYKRDGCPHVARAPFIRFDDITKIEIEEEVAGERFGSASIVIHQLSMQDPNVIIETRIDGFLS